MKFSEGDLVFVKKIYVTLLGYSDEPYLIFAIEDNLYLAFESGDSNNPAAWCHLDDGMIDKRRKWRLK